MALRNPYSAERSIYGRSGRVFDGLGNWLATVTEISATMTVDRMEVRRAGDFFVKYKAGEITGEGSMTFDKVNSDFETSFINYINGVDINGNQLEDRRLPSYNLLITLEDRGIPGISFDDDGNASSGHEAVLLQGVNFWSLPIGYSMTDLLSRDMDFTFCGIDLQRAIVDPTNVDIDEGC